MRSSAPSAEDSVALARVSRFSAAAAKTSTSWTKAACSCLWLAAMEALVAFSEGVHEAEADSACMYASSTWHSCAR